MLLLQAVTGGASINTLSAWLYEGAMNLGILDG